MREIIAKAQEVPGPGAYEADTDSLLARQRRLADRCVLLQTFSPPLALRDPDLYVPGLAIGAGSLPWLRVPREGLLTPTARASMLRLPHVLPKLANTGMRACGRE